MAKPKKGNLGGVPAHLSAILDALPSESRLEKILLKTPLDAKTLMELARCILDAGKRAHQQSAANKKHAASKKARDFVCKLWHTTHHSYRFKIEFSTAAAAVVQQKFDLVVKPATISRDWLKGIEQSKSMAVVSGAIAYVDGRYIKGKLKTTKG